MEVPKIHVDKLKIAEIVNSVASGELRIPRFQRDYVWDKPRVIKLLNSIYHEYPIGTFFLWKASGEYKHLYRNIPELEIREPLGDEKFDFILDGQQRITSLYVAIKGLTLKIQDSRKHERIIDYSDISFDLDKREFTRKVADNVRYVALSTIIDKPVQLVRTLEDDRADALDKCWEAFTSYPLSIVYVREQSLVEACEIFERINQGGIKLSLFDLVVASTWSNDFDLKDLVVELNETLQSSGFGAIEPDIMLQGLALVNKGQATRAAQLNLQREEIEKSWKTVAESFKLAVDYLSTNLGVKIYDFIPYAAMLPMTVYLFAKSSGKAISPTSKKFLNDWFWKSTFSERYKASTATLMGEDRRLLFDPVLEGKTVTIPYSVTLTSEVIKQNKLGNKSGIRNGVFCLLAQMNPRHFKNGSKLTLDRTNLSDYNSPERHHIFPRAYLRDNAKTYLENSIANFCFIPAELNKEILDKTPSRYFAEYQKNNESFDETLHSHLIPLAKDSPILTDDFDKFLNARSTLLLREIERKVGVISQVDQQLQSEPNKILDQVEESIREVIDSNLRTAFGDEYWSSEAVPPNIREGVSARLEQSKKRYPDKEAVNPLEFLSYCNIPDYSQLITEHWGLFEDEFTSKLDLENNFRYLSDYRNGIKHVRGLSPIEEKQGEAAVAWFVEKINIAKEDISERLGADIPEGETYYCRGENVEATGRFTRDGFYVFTGSTAKLDESNSAAQWVADWKDTLLEKGVVKREQDELIFIEPYLFSSPSTAAGIILGRNTNGWTKWRTEDGQTLDEVIRKDDSPLSEKYRAAAS